MKRIIIGGMLMFSGTSISFAIQVSNPFGAKVVQGVFIDSPFIVGILLCLIGLVVWFPSS